MILSGTIKIRPTAKQRPKLTKSGRAYNPAKTRNAQQQQAFFFRMLSRQTDQKFPLHPKLPLEVHLKFFTKGGKAGLPKVTTPDTDNLCKLTVDAIVDAGILRDDSQVTKWILEDYWAGKDVDSRIEFTISEHVIMTDVSEVGSEQQRLAL